MAALKNIGALLGAVQRAGTTPGTSPTDPALGGIAPYNPKAGAAGSGGQPPGGPPPPNLFLPPGSRY